MQHLFNSGLRSDLPVGEWIKKHRKAQKISRKELAEKTGLTPGYIASLEQGRSNPSLQALYAITRALHIKIEDLNK